MRVYERLLGITAAALTMAAAPAAAQTANDLFDQNSVQEIRLTVNSRDLRTLRANTGLNTYYAADLTWKNIKVRNVAIRNRGQGSRNPQKLGLRVDMSHYTTGQRFVGLNAIVLDNIWQDDSLIREKLSFTMFERLGLPAPRESFCRLYINNEYQGLYTITEEIDADFVKRVTGETDGTLFEFHWSADRKWFAEDLGSIDNYKALLEARTHALDADSTLYGPIQSLFKEVNGPDDNVWRSRVDQYIDLPAFVTHVAVEEFIVENDGILGFAGMNNFYLYRNQGTNTHRLFVWDKDNAFLFRADQAPVRTSNANILFTRAMTQPDLRDIYLTTLQKCAESAAQDGFLSGEIERIVGIISDAARSDTKKQFDNDRWDQAVDFLRTFAVVRPQYVVNEVARIRAGG
jgi:spore coat protein CotH